MLRESGVNMLVKSTLRGTVLANNKRVERLRWEGEPAMRNDGEESVELLAAGAICPVPDCGALTLTYRPTDTAVRDVAERWEFVCERCGFDFTANSGDLVFQSVPWEWLQAGVHDA